MKACAYSPYNVTRLMRRLRGVNSSIAEQTFSWFRGYARVFQDMRPARQHLFVLFYCTQHNDLLDQGNRDHLPHLVPGSVHKRPASYACTKVALRKKPARGNGSSSEAPATSGK